MKYIFKRNKILKEVTSYFGELERNNGLIKNYISGVWIVDYDEDFLKNLDKIISNDVDRDLYLRNGRLFLAQFRSEPSHIINSYADKVWARNGTVYTQEKFVDKFCSEFIGEVRKNYNV